MHRAVAHHVRVGHLPRDVRAHDALLEGEGAELLQLRRREPGSDIRGIGDVEHVHVHLQCQGRIATVGEARVTRRIRTVYPSIGCCEICTECCVVSYAVPDDSPLLQQICSRHESRIRLLRTRRLL